MLRAFQILLLLALAANLAGPAVLFAAEQLEELFSGGEACECCGEACSCDADGCEMEQQAEPCVPPGQARTLLIVAVLPDGALFSKGNQPGVTVTPFIRNLNDLIEARTRDHVPRALHS
jgi:hypothetical protein